MTEQPLSQRFEEVCRRYGDRVAVYETSGAPVPFANLFFTVLAFAEQLQDRGVGAGDLVAVHIGDPIAGTALRLALLRLGATVVAAPRGLEPPPDFRIDRHLVMPGVAGAPADAITVDGSWIRSPRRAVPVAGTGRVVSATSGTTGTPKLRLMPEAAVLAKLDRGLRLRGEAEGAAFIGYNPAASAGFNNTLRVWLAGQAVVHARPTPEASLAAMVAAGVATAYLAPYSFGLLLDAAEAGAPRPATLRRMLIGGGAVSPAQGIRGERLFGCEVINTYGTSETGSIAHVRCAAHPGTEGVLGRIYPEIEHRFEAEDGTPQPAHVGGELVVRVAPGHAATDFPSGWPLADPEGWVHTGDIGRILPDGSFQLTGRKSELLNVGGNKRAPSVFEGLARDFPGLAAVAAYRAPGAGGMDHVGLAVVPAAGFDPVAFEGFIGERFGPRYPAEIVVLDRLPFTEAGKIDRRRLTLDHPARHRGPGPAHSHQETEISCSGQ